VERDGHRCSIWLHDTGGVESRAEGTVRKRIADHYMDLEATVHADFRHWTGADVAVATGWDTVYKVLRLDGCGSRAYFVQDHEPEFYANSSRAVFAERSYKYGLHCICASPWLADLMRDRYGAEATPFMLGADSDEYAPLDVQRRTDTVVFYARTFTERRAVELGLLALEEVKRRRPDVRVILYGTNELVVTPYSYEHLGVVSPDRLQRLYSEATVGLSLSLTNYSLIPQEMMACGLPVVELAGRACEGVFGDDGSVISLADDNSVDIAAKVIELLDDPAKREAQAAAGLGFAKDHTWDAASRTVVDALVQIHAAAERPVVWRAGSLI
jgi:glycosyltransferase involved in cell wall biosynthesis